MTILNGFHEIVGSIIHTIQKVRKAFGVCRPLNNDLVKAVLGFEVTAMISTFLD